MEQDDEQAVNGKDQGEVQQAKEAKEVVNGKAEVEQAKELVNGKAEEQVKEADEQGKQAKEGKDTEQEGNLPSHFDVEVTGKHSFACMYTHCSL